MKTTFCFLLLLSILNSLIAQSHTVKSKDGYELLSQYTASNGLTYKIGDQIHLGIPSGENGEFTFFSHNTSRTVKLSLTEQDTNIYKWSKHDRLRIKKIYRFKNTDSDNPYTSTLFVLKYALWKYHLQIEGAIAKCEVKDCDEVSFNHFLQTKKLEKATIIDDKYTSLEKAKKLHDEGILNDNEYDKEKKRILKREY